MNMRRIKEGFFNLTHWFLILLFLSVCFFPGSPVKAVNYPPIKTGIPPAGILYYPNSIKKMCKGMSTVLRGQYSVGLNKTGPAPLAPLTGGPTTVPLSDIQILSTANRGKIDPPVKSVNEGSVGDFELKYTATEAGDVVISSTLGNANTAPIKFKVVKACAYFSFLQIQVDGAFDVPGSIISETYLFMAPATLLPEDPDNPLSTLQDENAELDYWGVLNRFKLPLQKEVTITEKSYKPATGHAAAQFYAEPIENGDKVHLYIFKKELKSDSDLTVTITGKSISKDTGFPDFLEEDIFDFFKTNTLPIVRDDMDGGGGTDPVGVRGLDDLKHYLDSSPGFTCKIDAEVTLKVIGD
jgi:hypothetical protein